MGMVTHRIKCDGYIYVVLGIFLVSQIRYNDVYLVGIKIELSHVFWYMLIILF
ncbi:hypothetical protein HanXRQr2_Chr07g0300841 [Helianthus annuus]|uniref:Uncharacterized protein n=1 Tax=Helianthus annuus TaxID=4232 RepID=A0A9K3NG78_HELAN|nr:hypothetical protein HanXRQr2_Chr07g0300841 [Helianthus annuus]KAJ0905191.1 hypothetical protein HanPSC8_Chr07g0291151 [Helianthus annuus]